MFKAEELPGAVDGPVAEVAGTGEPEGPGVDWVLEVIADYAFGNFGNG